MKENTTVTRRAAMGALAGTVGAACLASGASCAQEAAPAAAAGGGRIRQSVSRWCYGKIPMDEFCAAIKGMGIHGMDLVGPDDWDAVLKNGVEVALSTGPGDIKDGWNDPANHERLIAGAEKMFPELQKRGIRNMVVFSGNRKGMPDDQGLKNCAAGLKQILPAAEKAGVTVIMELLNSKWNHKDYMCDRTPWGAELAGALGAKNFGLLYDVYHMQIMEGDVMDTIREFHPVIAHYHTGGVPGRHEIDGGQELNYRRICEAIAETRFTGWLAHEFSPTRDPLTSLREAYDICNV